MSLDEKKEIVMQWMLDNPEEGSSEIIYLLDRAYFEDEDKFDNHWDDILKERGG